MLSRGSTFHRLLAAAVATAALSGSCAGAAPWSPPAIREELRKFGTFATVLHIAAHPDDENTQLITYLARSRGYRTGYLSITRGDGGQNEMGPEFGALLGLARIIVAAVASATLLTNIFEARANMAPPEFHS